MAKNMEMNTEKKDPYTVMGLPELEPKPKITADGRMVLEPDVRPAPSPDSNDPYRRASATITPPESDNEYIYTLLEDGSGYHVRVADTTQTHYGPYKTEIDGKPVVSMEGTFAGCTNLKSIHDIEGFTIPVYVSNINGIFADCTSLSDISQFPFFAHVKQANNMFHNCPELNPLDVIKLMTRTQGEKLKYNEATQKTNYNITSENIQKSPLKNFFDNSREIVANNDKLSPTSKNATDKTKGSYEKISADFQVGEEFFNSETIGFEKAETKNSIPNNSYNNSKNSIPDNKSENTFTDIGDDNGCL